MKEYLPVGSVVKLEGLKKKVIVMGIMQRNADKPDKEYDYMGVPYPEGFMGDGSVLLFDHSIISDVLFEGYTTPERDGMFALLKLVMESEDLNGAKM